MSTKSVRDSISSIDKHYRGLPRLACSVETSNYPKGTISSTHFKEMWKYWKL